MATLSELEILDQIVDPNQPGLSPEASRAILTLRFNSEALARINDLSAKNREGEMTREERDLLECYLRVGNFLNLLHAKARVSLAKAG